MNAPLVDWLGRFSDRCADGFSLEHQHPQLCQCQSGDEWSIFTAALRQVARPNGEVHQDDVRPLIRGRIEAKHIGMLYRRAKSEHLLTYLRKEPSGDVAGRNTHHDSPVYQLRAVA